MSEQTYSVQIFWWCYNTSLYLLITFWKSLSKKQVLVLHPMSIGVLLPSVFRGEAKKFGGGKLPPCPPHWMKPCLFVIGSEKRDHFALNAKFYRFSNTHHSDSPSAAGFILGLLAVQAFY